jgi:hypothetical protein
MGSTRLSTMPAQSNPSVVYIIQELPGTKAGAPTNYFVSRTPNF